MDGNKTAVFVETNVNNPNNDEKVNVTVTSVIKDNTGKEICRSANGGQIRHNEGLVRDTLTVDNPKLWSLDNPNM